MSWYGFLDAPLSHSKDFDVVVLHDTGQFYVCLEFDTLTKQLV
jgi:hypothetical protein